MFEIIGAEAFINGGGGKKVLKVSGNTANIVISFSPFYYMQ